MEAIKDLLRLLTDNVPPPAGMRHAITVSDGYDDVKDLDNVNLVISLAIPSGFLPVYLPDDDLKLTGPELFEEIMKLLIDQNLITQNGG